MSIDSTHHPGSTDIKRSGPNNITMEQSCAPSPVAKKIAPTAKIIAALVAVAKMKIYQHIWLDSNNLVGIMTHLFLSEYHVDVEKFNRAIGRSNLLKDRVWTFARRIRREYAGIIVALINQNQGLWPTI
jgi:hypothetical protein